MPSFVFDFDNSSSRIIYLADALFLVDYEYY